MNEFRNINIAVMAASVDSLEDAQKTVDRYKLSYEIGYDLNAKEISVRIGAFYDEKDGFLHATGFIINPEGKIANGVYSTLSIGRLTPRDCFGFIDYYSKKA